MSSHFPSIYLSASSHSSITATAPRVTHRARVTHRVRENVLFATHNLLGMPSACPTAQTQTQTTHKLQQCAGASFTWRPGALRNWSSRLSPTHKVVDQWSPTLQTNLPSIYLLASSHSSITATAPRVTHHARENVLWTTHSLSLGMLSACPTAQTAPTIAHQIIPH